MSIHIVDDESLLNTFYIYRWAILCGDEDESVRCTTGGIWGRERWWYKLTHVCQRWRNLILGSASYLGLCLVCTYGTPVADMLKRSPPLPLAIGYSDGEGDIVAENEEGMILALEQRHRIRRAHLSMPFPNLQKLLMIIVEEYPILEYLVMTVVSDHSTALMLPEAFQAPHLQHLLLSGFALPMGSRLLTTAVGLVTLSLHMEHPPAYFQPNDLLRWISFMPQLETLILGFSFPVPNRDVERQIAHTPNVTHLTLPNLRWFSFKGASAYLEAVVCRITAPRLARLNIELFKQLTFSVPCLLQFMNSTDNLRFDSAKLKLKFTHEHVYVEAYPPEAEMYALAILVNCWHLDWQVFSMAQILNPLSQMFSTVEHLTLEHREHSRSSEEHNRVDRTEWWKLLRSFGNVKTLQVDDGLVKEVSRCLQLDTLPCGGHDLVWYHNSNERSRPPTKHSIQFALR